jgi:hypothetical protein
MVCSIEWKDRWHGYEPWIRSKWYDTRDVFSFIIPGFCQVMDWEDLFRMVDEHTEGREEKW